jgi:hypothetical protein
MRRLFAVAIAVLFSLSGPTAGTQEPLRIGYFDIPPHVIGAEDGQPQGAAISYFEERIAPYFGVPFEWNSEVTPPTRLMKQLGDGTLDAMIFLGKTTERMKVFHYPDPYLVLSETVALKSDYPLARITSVDDLHGLRLGFLVGGRIPEALQSDRITFDLIAGKRLMERNVEKLLLGRIDGIYAPLSTSLANILDEMGVRSEIRLVPIDFLGPVEIYSVFSKKTVDKNTIDHYNSALSVAKSQISYEDYLEIYLNDRRN